MPDDNKQKENNQLNRKIIEDVMELRTPHLQFRSARLSLPPIRDDEPVAGPSKPSTAQAMPQRPLSETRNTRSGYHAACFHTKSIYMDWSSVKNKNKVTRKDVKEFLDRNKSYLENYILRYMTIDEFAMIYIKMLGRLNDPPTPVKKLKPKDTVKVYRTEFNELIASLNNTDTDIKIIHEISKALCSKLKVDGYRLFKFNPERLDYVQFVHVNDGTACRCCELLEMKEPQSTHILDIANSGAVKRILKTDYPACFPEINHTVHNLTDSDLRSANNIIYFPIFSGNGETIYLIELFRIKGKFTEKEEKIPLNILKWSSLATFYFNLYSNKTRERNMSDFLLDVVKSMFEEMVSLENLIKRILEFAQRLVHADRASLFLVDFRNYELVSTVFDLSYEPKHIEVERQEIRIPIERGIAGHVALSGETMNIPDAYADCRFNREIDEATGYKTISILCMPIKVRGKVIGVVQMVNKIGETNFDHKDEVSFEIFSNFFGLALHHAHLYDRIKRKEQKYRVTMEVLSYHNSCREVEVEAVLKDLTNVAIPLNDFYLNPYELNEFQKCQTAIKMFNDLFDMANFKNETLTRFVLTVKKNYRTVPYHNFDHGWAVANAMYVILKHDDKGRYDYITRLALFVASLCHDLDHRGYTNKYMSETASPLAAMYTTSTLEHHHFNTTVTILQQDGHNIFSSMSGAQYKRVLSLIKHCILATDLAAFFPNMAKMKDLHLEESSNTFDWVKASHRELAMAITMTAADLSAAAKPWDVQIRTVQVIFEEFYDQGDKERAAGRTPIAMMNRDMMHEQPACQVGFLSQICVPCYSMLYRILPKTEPMYRMVLKNLHNWKTQAEKIQREIKMKEDTEQSDEMQMSEEEKAAENEDESGPSNAKETVEEKSDDNVEIKDDDSANSVAYYHNVAYGGNSDDFSSDIISEITQEEFLSWDDDDEEEILKVQENANTG